MTLKRPIPSFMIFQDDKDHWRWNYLAPNGRIMATGTESYLREQGCVRAIRMLMVPDHIPIIARRKPGAGARPGAPADAREKDGAEGDVLELTDGQIVPQTESIKAAS